MNTKSLDLAMPTSPDTSEIKTDSLIERLNKQKKVAFEFQERKHEHWKENYLLYRDFVQTNRLTQRQRVNIPIMKETLKTWLSKLDETPSIVFEALGNEPEDKAKELILNEYWQYFFDVNQLEILDKIDKKIVFLQGRSFKKLNFINDNFVCDIVDPYDILIDPLTLPYDLETARYIIHTHIFKTLREILANENYDKKAKEELKNLVSLNDVSEEQKNVREALENKRERLKLLGVDNFDEFSAGDSVVEINEHYTNLFDEKENKWTKYLIVTAADSVILMKKPLKEVLGVEFYPFVSWSDDIDLNDIWSDSTADLIRTPNKILNIWFSQLLENRTYRNFGMMFYNSSIMTPTTFEPKPFGMYGIPVPEGRSLGEMFQHVQIPALTDTITEMDFVTKIIERASGVVSLDKGISEKKQITLGEVEILAGKSAERTVEVSKNYRRAWKDFAYKWYEIMKENKSAKAVKLFKRSYRGNWWEKDIKPSDWITKNGYEVIVRSSSEQEKDRLISLQKLVAIKAQFQNNEAFQDIVNKRMLEIGNFSVEEIQMILDEEKQKRAMAKNISFPLGGQMMPNQPQEQSGLEYDRILEEQKKILQNPNVLESL